MAISLGVDCQGQKYDNVARGSKLQMTYLDYIARGGKPVDGGNFSRQQPPVIAPVPDQRPLGHPRSVVPETLPKSAPGQLFAHFLRVR